MATGDASSSSAERPASPPAGETITFTVKATGDSKYTVTIAPSATVADLKLKLHTEHPEAPADPRLIYSGRVLKNPDSIAACNIKPGNTVHMVRPAASTQRTAQANAAGSAPPLGGMAAGSGNNPLAGLTGARYAGHMQLPSADLFGPDGGMGPPPGPEDLARQMENPMFLAQMNELLQNPQVLDMIIEQTPALRAMGPQARQMMQNPMFRQMMTNPDIMRSMTMMGPAGRGQGGFPAPGATGTTPGAPDADNQQQQLPNPAAGGFPPGFLFSPPSNTVAGTNNPLFPGYPAPAGMAPTPEQLQQQMEGLRNLMEQMDQLGGGGTLFGGLGGAGGAASPPPPADNRPPEERYEEQLRQMNEMGFTDFDANVAALRRAGGNVQGAINQLLGG